MALFGKLKKAFGFGESDYEEEENNDLPSAIVTPLNQKQREAAAEQAPRPRPIFQAPAATTEAPVHTNDAMPQEIFRAAVKIFNDAMPPFIKENLDVDAQSRAIYDALDSSMRRYLNNLATDARSRTEAEWAAERTRIHKEMEEIQSKAKQVEESNSEWKEQKLSAERQKRALSERVHELEKQVASFDAEREQYELENKSLINKLRATNIQEGDVDAINQENATLRVQLAQLQAAAASSTNADVDALHQQIATLEQEREKANSDIALLKKKCEIADGMINDLNHRASAAQQALTEREAQLAEARQAGANASQVENLTAMLHEHEHTIARLTNERDDLSEQLEKANAELDETHETIAQVEESLTKFEQIKASKDARISQLQQQVQTQLQELQDAHEKVESLNATIEANLRRQAESEADLRREIEDLKAAPERLRRRPGKKPKISSIDETLDDTDWLIPTPPVGTNARPSGIPDNEFGYQEPKRNNPPENSAQMSLW